MTTAHEVLPPTTTEIAEFSATAAGLAELRSQLEGATFDCTTTKGDKEARESRRMLVTLRTSLEATRKELKSPLLAKAKLIDEEAKRITGEIVALETPIDTVIREAEAVREAAKAERERVEAARVNGHLERIQAMRDLPLSLVGKPGRDIANALSAAAPVAEDFEEYQGQAEAAYGAMVDKLTELLDAANETERQHAELRQQRAEQEAREREAADRIAAADAAAAAARAKADHVARVERERLAAEIKAESDRIAAVIAEESDKAEKRRMAEEDERRERELVAAAELAEKQRLAEEAAELSRRQEIEAATLREAATEAMEFLRQLGHEGSMQFMKLASALARTPRDPT